MADSESPAREREQVAFNRHIDWDEEALLGTVFFGVEKSRQFPPLDIRTIRRLGDAGYLDLDASHNAAPSARELLAFAEDVVEEYRDYQFEVGVIGYMVGPERSDSRIRLEGISIRSPGPIPDALESMVVRQFSPDLLTVNEFYVELRWD